MNSNNVFVLQSLIAGGIILGSWAIALFFLRFWRRTRDRLFACFALSFLVFGIERIVIVSLSRDSEFQPYVYLLRFFAFLLIAFAIFDKNRAGKSGPK